MLFVRCSISGSQQAPRAVVRSFSSFNPFPDIAPHRVPHTWAAAAWYFIYLYSTFSKKNRKWLGGQQIFVEWLQATLFN